MAFTPNYTTNILSLETYNYKHNYDSNIYVVMASLNFVISKGSTKPSLQCFIKQRGEQFGDALPAILESNTKIIIRCYDSSNNVALNGEMNLIDSNLNEWSYSFTPFDFDKKGVYDSEIILIPATNDSESIIERFKINVV